MPGEGKKFEKGNSFGKNGRPKIPEDVRRAMKHNKLTVARLINKYMNMPAEQLKIAAKNTKTSSLELLIVSVIMKAVSQGDMTRFNLLLDRLIGKVTDKVQHSMPKPTVVKLFSEEAALVLGSLEENKEEEDFDDSYNE